MQSRRRRRTDRYLSARWPPQMHPPPPPNPPPPPPTNPPPHATLMAAGLGLNNGAPVQPNNGLMGSYTQAASAAAACGLTIQTPSSSLSAHSPPYSPGPQSAPVGMPQQAPPLALTPEGPPGGNPGGMGKPQAGPNSCPPGVYRSHSLDDSVLSPHTPWMQTRTQSRLPGADLTTGGATAAMAAAAGNHQQQQQMVSGLGLPVPGMPNGLQVPNSMGLAAGATSQQILAAASGLLQAQQGGLQQMQPMRVSPPPQPMPQLTPEQHRARVISQLVMERLCVWGEYRTVGDWPQELVAHGAMPAVAEALQASPTHSLTIPQLVTSVKERTGNAHGGKALDMLNLKAYVRCYPALFHLRSGRTAAGRPLDVVELRIESPDGQPVNAMGGGLMQQNGMLQNGMGGANRYGAMAPASAYGQPARNPALGAPPPLPMGMNGLQTNTPQQQPPPSSWAAYQRQQAQQQQQQQQQAQQQQQQQAQQQQPCGSDEDEQQRLTLPGQNPAQTPYAQNAAQEGNPASPGSTLQPKELFTSPTAPANQPSNGSAANGGNSAASDGGDSPRSLWGSPGLASAGNGFTLFGGFGGSTTTASNNSRMSSPTAHSPTEHGASLKADETAIAGMRAYTDGDDGTHGALEDAEDDESASLMFGQIDALFDGMSGADEMMTHSLEARSAYLKKHGLDKLFTRAIDRAMRHQVPCPAEFVAHELLQHVEQQNALEDAVDISTAQMPIEA